MSDDFYERLRDAGDAYMAEMLPKIAKMKHELYELCSTRVALKEELGNIESSIFDLTEKITSLEESLE